jgi:hypothetical protein
MILGSHHEAARRLEARGIEPAEVQHRDHAHR